MVSLKLLAGQLATAWKGYPKVRRDLASMPAGRPIFVSGTHRSGTTWFAKMLAVPGLWHIHEPFNPNRGLWSREFTYVRPDGLNGDVDRLFSQLLAGKHRKTAKLDYTHHWLMPIRVFRPPIRRIMVKDPIACLLSGYLSEKFDLHVRVLFRHPAGFVSSIRRLGWPSGRFLRQFLSDEPLMQDHLEPYRDLMMQHQESDGIAAATVLHGVLNLVQWNLVSRDPGMQYHLFEDLCQDPLGSFKTIFTELELPYTDDTMRYHASLCLHGSADPRDYRTHAVARNSRAMADSWKRELAQGEIDTIRTLWNRFDIPFYKDDRAWQVASCEDVGTDHACP